MTADTQNLIQMFVKLYIFRFAADARNRDWQDHGRRGIAVTVFSLIINVTKSPILEYRMFHVCLNSAIQKHYAKTTLERLKSISKP